MLYYYGRFAVDISPSFNLDKNNPELLYGKCLEVQFSGEGNSYESIFSDFKNHVDNLKEQEQMNSKVVTAEDISRIFTELEEKYGKDKAIGIFVGKTQESIRLIDGKSAAQILFEKLQEFENKEKETKVKDRDVVLVDGFLSALDKIQKDMCQIDHKYRDVILDVKLRRIFDWYNDKIELKSFDSLKDFYFRRQVK